MLERKIKHAGLRPLTAVKTSPIPTSTQCSGHTMCAQKALTNDRDQSFSNHVCCLRSFGSKYRREEAWFIAISELAN